jgi:sugar phosphate isomerase/epimerase
MTNRRDFLRAALAVGAAATPSFVRPASGAEKIERPFGPRMKLSLAAYSLRKDDTTFPKGLRTAPTAEDLAGDAMTLETFIDYCAELGLDGAELTGYYFPKHVQETPIFRPPTNLTEDPAARQARIDAATDGLNALKNRAFKLGLDVSGTAIGNDFCMPEGPLWAAEVERCKDWIDRATILGAPVIRIFAGKVPDGDTEENALARCVAAIDECLGYAARRGVFLALENHGGVTATPEQMLGIVAAVKPSPWFGVNFDSANFRTDDPYRDLEMIAPYAVNAQIKVSVHPNGKKERADFARIVDILKRANYRGHVAFEHEEPEDPKAAIPGYIEELRKLISG